MPRRNLGTAGQYTPLSLFKESKGVLRIVQLWQGEEACPGKADVGNAGLIPVHAEPSIRRPARHRPMPN